MGRDGLALEDAWYRYPGAAEPAVREVSVGVVPGEVVGLVGASGSGKSTLLLLLAGLVPPARGRLVLEGREVPARPRRARARALRALRQAVGYLGQFPEHQLFAATVAEDVAFGPRSLGLGPEEASRRVAEAVGRVGLDPQLLPRSPFTLSGGEQRRAAWAGVLALRLRFLLLDEPTAGLDGRAAADLAQLVRRLAREEGLGAVWVSHRLEEVAGVCDRIVVMRDGQVAVAGPARQVLAEEQVLARAGLEEPLYVRLWRRLGPAGSLPWLTEAECVRGLREAGYGRHP